MSKAHATPSNISDDVWDRACQIAEARHPNASYPQPRDVEDARLIVSLSKIERDAKDRAHRQEQEARWYGIYSAVSKANGGIGYTLFQQALRAEYDKAIDDVVQIIKNNE